MIIQLLSDLHLEAHAFTFRRHHQADVIVLAGDITTPKTYKQFDKLLSETDGIPTFYLTGNHEYYGGATIESVDKDLAAIIARYPNVKRIEDTWFLHKGYCFVGGTLWTDFKLPFFHGERYYEDQLAAIHAAETGISDFKTIPGMHSGKMIAFNDRCRRVIALAKSHKHPTIVCTHFLPSIKSVNAPFSKSILNPYFASDCGNLMGDNVLAWVHGHSHSSADYVHNGTRVVCNPRGYDKYENPAFKSQLLIEVKS